MADTPARFIRIPDVLWDKVVKKTKKEGTNVSAKIRDDLERYVADDSDSSVEDILTRIAADLKEVRRRLHVEVKRH